MSEQLGGWKRTGMCEDFSSRDIGKKVTLMGWVDSRRNLGGLIFVWLRDRSGIIQLVFDENDQTGDFSGAESLRAEFVIAVKGEVVARTPENVNPDLHTGEIEVKVEELKILSKAETPPFEIEENSNVREELRLKYRYLDLRRPDMQKNFILRNRIAMTCLLYTSTGQTDLDKKLAWLRELMEWQNDMKDSREFMEALKINFFSDNVFVFTPKGDVKDLVKGSTPLDFAYSIHSQIGHKCVGAKVNGRIVPLNYELKTGDIVEVMTNPNSKGPSRDWLSMVKTAAARSKIRAWFKKELKEENIHKGREALEQGAKRLGYELHTLLKPEWLKGIYKKYTLNNIDDMYAAVGYGGLAASQILSRLIELYRKENHISDAVVVKQPPKGNKSIGHDAVIVRGQPDMVVRLAKCCNPLPGDEIIGYVTRGRGVSVHRADCSNINDVDFEPARRIEVAWGSEETAKYMVEIQINGHDTPGLLAEISQLMFSLGYSIAAINARSMKNKDYCINLKFEVAAIRDLQALMEKIRRIPSVTEVFRVNN